MKDVAVGLLLFFVLHVMLPAQPLYPVERDGRWGYIDAEGHLRIPLQFDAAQDFDRNGISAPVLLKNRWGLIDTLGNWVVQPTWHKIERRYEGSRVLSGTEWSWVDAEGHPVPNPYFYVDSLSFYSYRDRLCDTFPVSDGRRRVERDGKIGYVDSAGTLVIPCRFDQGWMFWRGIAIVNVGAGQVDGKRPCRTRAGGKWGVIDTNGKYIIPLIYDTLYIAQPEPLLYGVRVDSGYGLCSAAGTPVIPPRYGSVTPLSDSLFLVSSIPNERERDSLLRISSRRYMPQPTLPLGVIDRSGREILPLVYNTVRVACNGRFIVSLDSLYGVVDRSGKEIVPFKYEFIEPGCPGQYVAGVGKKRGVIDGNGKWIVEPVWDDVQQFGESLFYTVRSNDTGRPSRKSVRSLTYSEWIMGLADTSGRMVIRPYWRWIRPLRRIPGLCVVEHEDRGKGILSVRGDTVLRPGRYLMVTDPDSAVVKVVEDGPSFGCIRPDGTMTGIRFYAGYDFSDGINCIACDEDGDGFYRKDVVIDTAGRTLFRLDDVGAYGTADNRGDNGLIALESRRGTVDFFDHSGTFRFSTTYSRGFSEGLAASYGTGNNPEKGYGFIDTTGRMVIPQQFADVGYFSEGLAPAAMDIEGDTVWGYVDREGRWVVTPRFGKARSFSDGLAAVLLWTDSALVREAFGCFVGEEYCDRVGKWGFINSDGEILIPVQYYYAHDFSEGVASVRTDSGHVLIDREGTPLFPPSRFDWIGPFSEGVAPATLDGSWLGGRTDGDIGFIDRNGEWVIAPGFDDAGPFRNGRAVVTLDIYHSFFYITTTGMILWRE